MENQDLNVIVSISSIVIAITALVVSIWQGFVTRKHNRLSVKPRLQVSSEYDKEMIIKNDGFGPALISSLKVKYNGKTFDFFVRSQIEELMKIANLDDDTEWGDFSGLPVLGTGNHFPLWRLKEDVNTKDVIAKMHLLNRKIQLEGEYRSFYDEVFTF